MQWNTSTAAGSQWVQTFTLKNGDGSLVNLTGLTWEFVIRPTVTDLAVTPLVKVTTTATSQGQIVVDTVAATVTVTLTPAATALLGKGARPFALWANPGTTTAVCWLEGTFNSSLVAAQ
jgi:hypothetical protein